MLQCISSQDIKLWLILLKLKNNNTPIFKTITYDKHCNTPFKLIVLLNSHEAYEGGLAS